MRGIINGRKMKRTICTRMKYAGGHPAACTKTDRRACVLRRALYGGTQRPFRIWLGALVLIVR
jgi:hypothetical protein